MSESHSSSYAAAGVDIVAGYKSVELMKEHVRRTMVPGVLGGLGGFGGLFQLDLSKMKKRTMLAELDAAEPMGWAPS